MTLAAIARRLAAAREEVVRWEQQREVGVLAELAKGRTQKSCAAELGISQPSVCDVVKKARARLGGGR